MFKKLYYTKVGKKKTKPFIQYTSFGKLVLADEKTNPMFSKKYLFL